MSEHYLVRVYESELALIADETREYTELETGGSLFGLFSHGGSPTIFLATRPAGQVQRSATSIELDPDVTRRLEETVWERYGVQCIGMWHSHHWLGLLEPSGGDRERTRRYAQKYNRPQYIEVLANFKGEQSSRVRRDDHEVQLTPFFYLDARNLARAETTFEVLPGVSPLRRALSEYHSDPRLSRTLYPPHSRRDRGYQLAGSLGSPTPARGIRRLFGAKAPEQTPAIPDREATEDSRDAAVTSVPGEVDHPVAMQSPAQPHLPPSPEPDGTPHRVVQPAPTSRPAPALALPAAPGPSELRPIPDMADYVTTYIEPVMQRLASGYHVELDFVDQHYLAVRLARHGHYAQLLLVLGWDGAVPIAVECDVITASSSEQWRYGPVRFGIQGPLQWGLERLAQLP